MTTPKFKIGDRVKWKDHEGRARPGVIVELPFGCLARFDTCFIREEQVLQPGRWHESHLSLDVPEPKQFATNREVELGVEIINPDWQIFQLRAVLQRIAGYCGGACRKTASHKFHLLIADEAEAVIAGQKKDIERLEMINTKHLYDAAELSRRLTEEIGARHRERIAKEAAQKQLAQTKENERWCCNKLSELANELSAERLAKTSAQKELAEANDKIKRLKSLFGEM